MRSGKPLFIRGMALTLMLLMLCASALANVERDDDGGIWDWDNGTYTAPDGRVVSIIDDDAPSEEVPQVNTPSDPVSAVDGGLEVVQNVDGSLTMIDDGKTYIENADGSITVVSGQGQIIVFEGESEKKNELSGDEVWALSMQNAAINNGSYTPTWYFDGSGSMTEVSVEYTGIYRSMINLNGEKVLVSTANLIWESEAPADKVLAVISAKSYARLFEKSTKKSTILDKIYCGTVVRVLKTDKNWSLVDFKGIRGYVQTDSLKFYANEAREYRAGYVATKSGHTYGDSSVHVRNDPKGAQQEEYRVGTPITVFEDDGKWCRIEVEGHMCYLMRQFMVYEDTQAAAAEG